MAPKNHESKSPRPPAAGRCAFFGGGGECCFVFFPALSTTQRCDWPGVAAVALNFPAEKSSPAAMRPRVVSLHGGRWSVSQTARVYVGADLIGVRG